MATVTVSREDIFPVGTSVAAYPATVFGVPSSGAPYGTAEDTQSVAAGGVLTLTLTAGLSYILRAASPDRYLRVNTSVTESGGGGGTGDVTTEELDDAIAAHSSDSTSVHGISDTSALATDSEVSSAVSTHNSDETAVHGISDTSAIKGVVVWTSGGVPARPTGFASVEWFGPDDPAANAEDGDTWVSTAAP